MKRFFAALLTLALLLVLLPAAALAAEGIPGQDGYTLTLNPNYNGGVGQMYDHVTSMELPSLTRSGHVFNGWAESAAGGVRYLAGDKITLTSNTTLYAVWDQGNGGGSVSISAAEIKLADFDADGNAPLTITADSLVLGSVKYSDGTYLANSLRVQLSSGTLRNGTASLSFQFYSAYDNTIAYVNTTFRLAGSKERSIHIDRSAIDAAASGNYTGSISYASMWMCDDVVWTGPSGSIPLTLTIPERYAVTVSGGTADKTKAAAGEAVTITANAPASGQRFKAWTGADGLTFTSGSAASAEATFTMPAQTVEVTATYEDIPTFSSIQVKVLPAGNIHTIVAEPGDLVENVKAKIEDKTGIPPERQVLRYNDKHLENGKLLAEYGIGGDAVLSLYVKETVTYKVVGGTWADRTAEDRTETVYSGFFPANVPTGMLPASGYTGGAWDTDPVSVTITGDTTFTYTFAAIPTYTVALNPNGGTCAQPSVTVTYGQAYGTLPTPTRTGHKFEGWWTTKETGGKQVTASTVCYATGNYTMFARWEAKKYTVTLNPNGGSVSPTSISVTYDKAYGELPTPTRTGHKFEGWWTTKDTGGKQVTASTICYATGNYTMFARWMPRTYTVALNPNGGTCSKSSITVTYGQAYGTLPTPTRRGYTFKGWWTTQATGGKQVTAATVCKATGNYTMYARWEEGVSYTVRLDPNGGTCAAASVTVTYGQAYGTLPTPTRRGYKFAGWWTTKTEGGKQVTKDTICYATGNYTLFARWTALASYTVTLNPNGGSCATASVTVYYSQTYGDLPTPTRRGYKFAGWWTTKTTGGKQVTKDTICYATGNYTLFARWTALASYTVTLNPNGGTCATASVTVYYSQAYGTLPTPTRAGYSFNGWWTAKTGGKQVTASTVCYATGDYTLYARWTQSGS